MDKASHAILKLEATKNLIDDYAEIKRFKRKAFITYIKVVRLMRNEIFRISNDDIDNFWFRNFSSKMRKFGSINNYFLINVNLIALIAFVLIFFPMFDIVERAPAAFIVENNVTTITAINFALYLSFTWIEFIFHSCQNNDLLGFRSTTISQKILQEYDFGSNPERAHHPLDQFR